MITRTEARELAENLNDVFTPEGGAGTISRLYTFSTPGLPLTSKGQCALVIGEHVHGWFPISELESEASIRRNREAASAASWL